MFNAVERATIQSELSEKKFRKLLRKELERLGDVAISDTVIEIQPKGLVTFLSTVWMSGRVRKDEDGYKISIDYSLAPSTVCWILGVPLFICTLIGGAIVLVPLIEQAKVTRLVQGALQDLKDATDEGGPEE